MKYPCGIIQDLLPLYVDGVCNAESRQWKTMCRNAKSVGTVAKP